MNEFEYKFSLWQFDVVTDFNRTTQVLCAIVARVGLW